jgi:hypothetical protein
VTVFGGSDIGTGSQCVLRVPMNDLSGHATSPSTRFIQWNVDGAATYFPQINLTTGWYLPVGGTIQATVRNTDGASTLFQIAEADVQLFAVS